MVEQLVRRKAKDVLFNDFITDVHVDEKYLFIVDSSFPARGPARRLLASRHTEFRVGRRRGRVVSGQKIDSERATFTPRAQNNDASAQSRFGDACDGLVGIDCHGRHIATRHVEEFSGRPETIRLTTKRVWFSIATDRRFPSSDLSTEARKGDCESGKNRRKALSHRHRRLPTRMGSP
jgi:hypothetical protein